MTFMHQMKKNSEQISYHSFSFHLLAGIPIKWLSFVLHFWCFLMIIHLLYRRKKAIMFERHVNYFK